MTPHIELNIDELVLHGFSPREAGLIRDAMQIELGRLLLQQGLPATGLETVNIERLNAGDIRLNPSAQAIQTGASIAQAVYEGISTTGASAPYNSNS